MVVGLVWGGAGRCSASLERTELLGGRRGRDDDDVGQGFRVRREEQSQGCLRWAVARETFSVRGISVRREIVCYPRPKRLINGVCLDIGLAFLCSFKDFGVIEGSANESDSELLAWFGHLFAG